MSNDITGCTHSHGVITGIETSYDRRTTQMNLRTDYADGHSHIEYDIDPLDPRLRDRNPTMTSIKLDNIFDKREDARGEEPRLERIVPPAEVAGAPLDTKGMERLRARVDKLIEEAVERAKMPMPHHDMSDEEIKAWADRAGLAGVPVQSHAFWDIQRALMRSSYDRGFAAGRHFERARQIRGEL